MTKFKISGKTLKALADLADLLLYDDFFFKAQGAKLRIIGGSADMTTIVDAVFDIEGGPETELVVAHSLKRFKKGIESFAKDEKVEVGIDGVFMVFQVGRRRRKVAMVDPRNLPNPRFPNIPWDAKAEVPVKFILDSAKASEASEVVKLTLGDGLLSWKAESEMDAYEDAVECPTEGSAHGLFTPHFIAKILDPAASEKFTLHMLTGLPLKAEFAVYGGHATIALAGREVQE